jgi:DNA-binding protein YbaB
MAKKTDLTFETTTAVIDHADTIIPLSQFIPLINDVSDIVLKVKVLYESAQHNKKIAKLFMERISAAYTSVHILQAREELLTPAYYRSFQRLVQVLHNMKKYIEEIIQYNTVQKLLRTKSIEKKYEELCKEYDSSMVSLNLNLSVNFLNLDINKEVAIVKDDVTELLKFQDALIESMNDVKQKVSHTNDEQVNESKIDRISLLPFDDYEADEEERSEKLRKYVHVKTKEEFAFKIVEIKHINNVKNQITILKKLQDCQNIINFYGLTSDGAKTFLVTEWAEKGNLRDYIIDRGQNIDLTLKIRIAYDIAKGLNFLNSVKVRMAFVIYFSCQFFKL